MDDTHRAVTAHYSRHGDLTERILAAVAEAAADPERPTQEELAGFDQFHMRGREATRELAERADVAGATLLDVGCGIGGPARMLAAEFGCEVTGLDLTESYCLTAAELSRRVGLAGRTRFLCTSALHLPFADRTWPLAWTQHASMNVADKRAFYAEIARVLAPGGRLVLYDIIAGPVREPHFPVPWAAEPRASFLLPAPEMHARLTAAGLEEVVWHDATAEAVAQVRETRAKRERGEDLGPGPHRFMGDEFPEMMRNLARNLEEGRIALVQAVFRKPG
jgi:SAM-dependent methyltransferase